jgi:hypothetical protein
MRVSEVTFIRYASFNFIQPFLWRNGQFGYISNSWDPQVYHGSALNCVKSSGRKVYEKAIFSTSQYKNPLNDQIKKLYN